MLRTNLQFTSPDRPLRTLLITSSGPDEGKSTITANLAVSLAQTKKTVIAVNADLRRPTLHRFFGASQSVGLTSVLVGRVDLEEALQPSGIPGLRVLAAGPTPPNPAELLGSERMREIVKELRSMADIVLFDTPPIIAVTDPGLIAAEVDGCLLVVNSGQTPREVALASKEQLEKVGARIVGAVVNRVDQGAGYYYYYYYGESTEKKSPFSWRSLFRRGGKRPSGTARVAWD